MAATFDVPYVIRLFRVALRRQRPFTWQAARGQPRLPVWLRPVPVLWWSAHFAGGAIAAVFTAAIHERGFAGERPLTLFMTTCYGFAANGFLMAAVVAATPSERAQRTVWQWRVLIDAALALVGTVVAARVG